jgi:hypothetical protein
VAVEESEVESEDEEIVEAASQGIEDPARLHSVLKRILQTNNPKSIMKYIKEIEDTEDPVILRKFVHVHGLKIMNCLLKDFRDNVNISRSILRVLDKVPIITRNSVEDLKLDKRISRYRDHEDVILSMLAQKVILEHATYKVG